MANTHLHHTNDTVKESGKYICAAGEARELQQGDTFPECPVSHEPTTWKHADHEHQSGEDVTETGTYVDRDGEKVELKLGDTFPNCPNTGQPTGWKHA
ncbi:hypothetical protein JOC78_001589 [Bacillus ectoiniformans]|uniref:hypothetical protein n=1 Tax=Bacillus ectoiniformans TaxID=1494429 RepID=UPI00195E4B37|nr:hypothetical protein [Bacillus ectoiniformans]MBM7648643.1 hypothetical protein [Bacillus ectoiniformans]